MLGFFALLMANTKKYKIVYDRDNCIGAGSCTAVFAERWAMNNKDDKADLVGGVLDTSSKRMMVLEFSQEELERFMESAQVCPVNVIHIIDLETGEKLI